MNQIRPWLYIGKYRDTLDYRYLSAHNITAMLLLAELVEHPGITSLYLAVEDGEALPREMLAQGVEFVTAQKQAEQTVLVACGAGVSRSAAFAVAALKEIENISLRQAMHIVKQSHSDSMPHFKLWQFLCTYYNEAVPWTEIAT
jgi:protein-tyrosine phosphatase